MVVALKLGSTRWESCKDFEGNVVKNFKCLDDTAHRGLGFEETPSGGLKENKQNQVGHWKRHSLYYGVAKNVAIVSSAVTGKVANVPNELGDAVLEIFTQCCSFHSPPPHLPHCL